MFFFRKVGTVSNQRVLCYIILRSVYLRKVQPHNFTCIVLRNECLGVFFLLTWNAFFPPLSSLSFVLFCILLLFHSTCYFYMKYFWESVECYCVDVMVWYVDCHFSYRRMWWRNEGDWKCNFMDEKRRREMHTTFWSRNSQILRQSGKSRRNFVVVFAVYLTMLPVMQTIKVEWLYNREY